MMLRCLLLFGVLMLPACTMCDGDSQRGRDPNHHLEVREGIVTYNGHQLSWTAPVSTWVEVLGPPSSEHEWPAVEGDPESVARTSTRWTQLGLCVSSVNGLPRTLYVRTSGEPIEGEPLLEILLLPDEAGQPTLGVFPGTVAIERAWIAEGHTVPQVASIFGVRCYPHFTVYHRGLFGWVRGGGCTALDFDTSYYFYNGFHSATERVEYIVGVEITHYAHDELDAERREANWAAGSAVVSPEKEQ
ncbi:MAG: hypothetical protein R3B40_29340 [Polyangiales bacterium]